MSPSDGLKTFMLSVEMRSAHGVWRRGLHSTVIIHNKCIMMENKWLPPLLPTRDDNFVVVFMCPCPYATCTVNSICLTLLDTGWWNERGDSRYHGAQGHLKLSAGNVPSTSVYRHPATSFFNEQIWKSVCFFKKRNTDSNNNQ